MNDSDVPPQSLASYPAEIGEDESAEVAYDALMGVIHDWQHHLAQAFNPAIALRKPTPIPHGGHSSPTFVSNPASLPTDNPNLVINLIIVRLFWLGLCEHQDILPQGTLLAYSHQPHAHQHCWCELQQLLPVSHDLPQDRYPNPWVSDAIFQPILTQVADLPRQMSRCLSHAYPSPEALLGQVYEFLLAHPLAQPLPCPSPKKMNGIYYTPTRVVENMVEQTLGRYCHNLAPGTPNTVTILDPACGSGMFLAIAYRHLLQWYRHHSAPSGPPTTALEILQRHIYGVDLDPQAVELTRLSLWLVLWSEDRASLRSPAADLRANIQWGNALLDVDVGIVRNKASTQEKDPSCGLILGDRPPPFTWSSAFPQIMKQGGFDIVLGNPPYVDAEWMTRYQPLERRYYSRRYQAASGNWDLFCVFCEQALRLCKTNGLHSFIVPNKLASADYAQATRTLLSVDNQLLYLRDYSRISVFSIAVYPLVYVIRKAAPMKTTVEWERLSEHGLEQRLLAYAPHFGQPQRPWAIAPNSSLQTLITHIRNQGTPLSELATVHGAATVAEAYGIKPLLRDTPELWDTDERSPSQPTTTGLKFVNSGTVDPYQFLWGQKSTRYLKDCYQAPMIPAECIDQLPPKRLYQALHPKIVVAGMTRGLECAVDFKGEFLAGKSTTIITSAIDLRYLAAILNSQLMNQYYKTEFGGNALNGGYLRIGPPQLKTLPIVVGSDRQFTTITTLVDQLIHRQLLHPVKLKDDSEQVAILREIDQQVCTLYGLSEEAVAVLNAQNSSL
ncbi:MAG: DNA methyltransferase [Leptolyngbyaceae cyanobacterium]